MLFRDRTIRGGADAGVDTLVLHGALEEAFAPERWKVSLIANNREKFPFFWRWKVKKKHPNTTSIGQKGRSFLNSKQNQI